MGIKIGDSTNYIEIANGTLTMAGTTTVFDDVQVPGLAIRTTGSNDWAWTRMWKWTNWGQRTNTKERG